MIFGLFPKSSITFNLNNFFPKVVPNIDSDIAPYVSTLTIEKNIETIIILLKP